MQQNQHILIILAQYSLFLLVFLPFIVFQRTFFSYIEGKTVYIRLVAALAFILLAAFFAFARKEQKKSFIAEKISLFKSPIAVLAFLFLFSVGMSTIFAQNNFRAFFGNIERGEGLVGFFFFFLIFLLSLFLWKKREWNIFFAAAAAGGVILFLQALFQFLEAKGTLRPYAALGNPAYLAAYFLFVIFSALILFAELLKTWPSRKKGVNLIFSFILFVIVAIAIAGILLTQVRGVMLGLGIGVLAGGVFFISSAANYIYKGNKSLRRTVAAFMILSLAGLALGMFVLSSGFLQKPPEFLQKIPGLEKIVKRLESPGALRTRLVAARVSLNSIDPRQEGLKKFLIGWGPDNYNIAYNSHFDPNYFRYEVVWFDRAHNRVLDVLVMEGLLGLIFYLGLWGAVFWIIFKGKKGQTLPQYFQSAALLFFAASYFTQNLFLFDSPATSVALFAFFAFVAFESRSDKQFFPQTNQNKEKSLSSPAPFRNILIQKSFQPAVFVLAVIALILFFWATFFPYLQMKNYINLKVEGVTVAKFNERLDAVLYPYSYAQDRIRVDLIKSVNDFPEEKATADLRKKMMEAGAELVKLEPYEPRYAMNMGLFLEDIGDLQGAEEYYRKAAALVPKRPDLAYLVAQNLMTQGRIEEGKAVLDKMLAENGDIPLVRAFYGIAFAVAPDEYTDQSFQMLEQFLDEPNALLPTEELAALRAAYEHFMIVFYQRRDEKNFMAALVRAKYLEETWEAKETEFYLQGKRSVPPPKQSKEYAKAIEAFQEIGWDAIGLQQGTNE